ncbi:sigma-70 family RNA polymerase sigma factor [Pseudolysinimonas sp.]|jgi:RNA polymerase sigma factor (sigma-70 family)|uniref:sigma-70 family RNA polymerase sigma factor n=1 Tax=Pseudolysinimonas sp. TaxID=2680009 RepID=UPI0037837126
MSSQDAKPTTSDAELIERARSGDPRAFGELWRRHYRSAARVARQFTSSIDADDLVSEAYARIYQRVLAGGGPTGAFRPYLYTTIRNLASSWGAASRDIQVDIIEDFEDDRIPDDPAAWALDRTLTARAFRALPERWQTVLWYTEVEGMDPHEVAPLMGMTANGVAALSYRAREGLRKAWLQAHVSDATASGECQWAMSRLGEHARDGLSNRDRERLTVHLADCAKCTIVSDEVDEVGSHLAMVMLPLVLGGVAGGSLLATLGQASGAAAAELPIPDVPLALQTMAGSGVLAAPIVGGLSLGAATGAGSLVGGFAVAAVIAGSIALGLAPTVGEDGGSPPPPAAVEQQTDPEATGAVEGAVPAADLGDGVVGDVLAGDVQGIGETLGETVDSVIDTITNDDGSVIDADIALRLTGTGTPGATVTARAAGQVYASVQVDASGHYVLDIAAFPSGLASLELVQTVDRNYLKGLVLGDNPLAEVLGLLDGLIGALIQPLGLSSGGGTVAVHLVG